MANGTTSGLTKAELEDAVSQALDTLQDAYQPESDRETLATAIGDAIDILQGDGDTDDDSDSDLDDDDDADPQD